MQQIREVQRDDECERRNAVSVAIAHGRKAGVHHGARVEREQQAPVAGREEQDNRGERPRSRRAAARTTTTSSSTSIDGSTSVRRRLSRIFQRAMALERVVHEPVAGSRAPG